MKKSRINQHGVLLVALASAHGLHTSSAWAAIDSPVTISGPVSDYVVASPVSDLWITNQGSLTSQNLYSPALSIYAGAQVVKLTNDGTIDGTGGYGIRNEGTINTLINNGTIIATNGGGGLNNAFEISHGGWIDSLINNSVINSSATNGPGGAGISNRGTIVMLNNGIDGKIIGYTGIDNAGRIDTLKNSGKITADSSGPFFAGPAIVNHFEGSIGVIDNIGSISTVGMNSSHSMPAILNFGNIDQIHNSGVISGELVAIESQGHINTILNTGTIRGDITLFGNTAPVTFIGSDSVADMGMLTGSYGVGNIQSSKGVIFSSGAMLLDDNIHGGLVNNKAATLKLINKINIGGDYVQGANATLISGVSDNAIAVGSTQLDHGYGRLEVLGSANVEAGSRIVIARSGKEYAFAPGQRYVVIDANTNGTQYNADKLKYKVDGYNQRVSGYTYTDSNRSALVVSLDKGIVPIDPVHPVDPTKPVDPSTPVKPTPQPPKPTKPDAGWATVPNATRALNGLASYSGISPQLLELYNASLAIGDQKEANRVGERLSPGQGISTSTATSTSTSAALGVVSNHMDAQRNPQIAGASGVSTGDGYEDWIVWGQPFGGYARQDSTSDVSGYSAKFGGLILGADRTLGDAWRLGAAVNYSNTSVHGKDNLSGNSSTADNYGLIGYASYTGEPWFVNLSAGVNRQNYQSTRQVDFTGFDGRAQSKFNGQSVTLQSEFGYPFVLPADVVLTPMASLSYGYQHVDGYSETGGNGMALNVGASHSQSVVSDIGARVERTFATSMGNLTPFAQLSWIHQYDNRQMSSTASYAADTIGETRFTTKGIAPVEDMMGVALGSTLFETNDINLDARYDLQAGERYQAHTFSLRLQKTF